MKRSLLVNLTCLRRQNLPQFFGLHAIIMFEENPRGLRITFQAWTKGQAESGFHAMHERGTCRNRKEGPMMAVITRAEFTFTHTLLFLSVHLAGRLRWPTEHTGWGWLSTRCVWSSVKCDDSFNVISPSTVWDIMTATFGCRHSRQKRWCKIC